MNAASAVQCDVLVVGSGAAGLATAVTARVLGLDVLVVEKAPVFGGTTAWSGGWLWIPQSPPAVRAGITDSIAAARAYLQAELGADFDAARIDAFLTNGPRMVEFFENETAVRFLSGTAPDFHADLPGAAVGRPICAEPFDGRELGGLIDKLRLPLAEVSLRGMAIAAGSDLRHFMNATRVPASAWYAARRVARYALDVLRYGRGMHLVNGNALAARLLKSASDRGVRLWTESRARDLIVANGAVTGAWIETLKDGLPFRRDAASCWRRVAFRTMLRAAAAGFHTRPRATSTGRRRPRRIPATASLLRRTPVPSSRRCRMRAPGSRYP